MTMRKPWIVIACAAFIVTLAMGVRQAFGLFLPPMSIELHIDRGTFGLAIAISNLVFGLAQPFVGALGDKHGAGRVVLVGAILYALGLLGSAWVGSALGLHLTFGFVVGVALAATTFVVVLGAVGRVVPPERRSLAFGIVTAGGSLGQFLVVPFAARLLGDLGYHLTLIVLAGLVALCAVLALGVAGKPAAPADEGPRQSLKEALREAAGNRSYWLLNAGFFVCGFHIAFIATHFPAYLADKGLGLTTGARPRARVGRVDIFGGDRLGLAGALWRPPKVRAGLYAARGIAIALFLILPLTAVTALVFAAVMGFLWLGTVPLTSGLVGQIFGVRYLSTLYGSVFLSHQVGSFFGAWAAGWFYDRTGSYDAAWTASILLALFAAVVHLPIRDAPVARLQPA